MTTIRVRDAIDAVTGIYQRIMTAIRTAAALTPARRRTRPGRRTRHSPPPENLRIRDIQNPGRNAKTHHLRPSAGISHPRCNNRRACHNIRNHSRMGHRHMVVGSHLYILLNGKHTNRHLHSPDNHNIRQHRLMAHPKRQNHALFKRQLSLTGRFTNLTKTNE